MNRLRFGAALVAVLMMAGVAVGQCGPNGCPPDGGNSIGDGSFIQKLMPQRKDPALGQTWSDIRPGFRDRFKPARSECMAAFCQVDGGSGTLVSKGADWGVVLTCAHGGMPQTATVRFPVTREVFRAVLIVGATATDVCFYRLDGRPRAAVAVVARRLPRQGERIGYGGFGMNSRWQAFEGEYIGELQQRDTDSGSMDGGVRWKGSARPGDSGGPAWIPNGGVFSFVTATSGDGSFETTGPSLDQICQTIEQNRFLFPWNADTAREQSRNASEVARETERTRQEEIRSGVGVSVGVDSGMRATVTALANTVEAMQADVTRHDAEIGTVTEALEAIGALDAKTDEAGDKATAAEAAALAAKAAADEATTKTDEVQASLGSRIRGGIVSVVGGFFSKWGWLGGIGAVGLGWLGWWLVKRLIVSYAMPIAQAIDRITDMIPGEWDDNLLDGRMYGLAEKLGTKKRPAYWNTPGMNPYGTPYPGYQAPPQPPAPQPTAPVAPPAPPQGGPVA